MTVLIGWTLSTTVILILIFIQALKETPVVLSILFPAFGKTIWSICMAWIIIACTMDQGGKDINFY